MNSKSKYKSYAPAIISDTHFTWLVVQMLLSVVSLTGKYESHFLTFT